MTLKEKRQEEILQWKANGYQPRQDDQDWVIAQLDATREQAKDRLEALRPLAALWKPVMESAPSHSFYGYGEDEAIPITIGQIREAKRLVDEADKEEGR